MITPDQAVVLAAALSVLGVAFTGALNFYNAKKKNAIDYSSGLSASEAAFRRDMIEQLAAVNGRLDVCEKRHRECEEGRTADRKEINRLKDEIRRMRNGRDPAEVQARSKPK